MVRRICFDRFSDSGREKRKTLLARRVNEISGQINVVLANFNSIVRQFVVTL